MPSAASPEPSTKLHKSKSSIDFLLNRSDSKDEIVQTVNEPELQHTLPKLSNIMSEHDYLMREGNKLLGSQMLPGAGSGYSRISGISGSGYRMEPNSLPSIISPTTAPNTSSHSHFGPQYQAHHTASAAYPRPTFSQQASFPTKPTFQVKHFSQQQIIPVIPKEPIQPHPQDRQPQLKYSHKIAERKRRKDMNDTFDELRAVIPIQNIKMSKWEILMTAADHITHLQAHRQSLALERETLHRELGLPPKDLVTWSQQSP